MMMTRGTSSCCEVGVKMAKRARDPSDPLFDHKRAQDNPDDPFDQNDCRLPAGDAVIKM